MPQLAKGGKWVFGWVLVGPRGELTIPPEACDEYGFHAGDEVIFLPGSRPSGGFGLSTPRLLAQMAAPLQTRALCRGQVGENGQLVVPSTVGLQPGTRLLAVRGSGRALGFVVRGSIYDEALKHPALEVFGQNS
jgi:bifunctional DNA-binding transcriptional regulator/antitoxin component of YhaV-PrlF toxin-antitoxin module